MCVSPVALIFRSKPPCRVQPSSICCQNGKPAAVGKSDVELPAAIERQFDLDLRFVGIARNLRRRVFIIKPSHNRKGHRGFKNKLTSHKFFVDLCVLCGSFFQDTFQVRQKQIHVRRDNFGAVFQKHLAMARRVGAVKDNATVDFRAARFVELAIIDHGLPIVPGIADENRVFEFHLFLQHNERAPVGFAHAGRFP